LTKVPLINGSTVRGNSAAARNSRSRVMSRRPSASEYVRSRRRPAASMATAPPYVKADRPPGTRNSTCSLPGVRWRTGWRAVSNETDRVRGPFERSVSRDRSRTKICSTAFSIRRYRSVMASWE
jgi:hypothetical protein